MGVTTKDEYLSKHINCLKTYYNVNNNTLNFKIVAWNHLYYIWQLLLCFYSDPLSVDKRVKCNKCGLNIACKKIITVFKKNFRNSLLSQDDNIMAMELFEKCGIFQYIKSYDVFASNVCEKRVKKKKMPDTHNNKCTLAEISIKDQHIKKSVFHIEKEGVTILSQYKIISDSVDSFEDESINKPVDTIEDENINKSIHTFKDESINKSVDTIEDENINKSIHTFKDESINKPVVITEDEYITRPAFALNEKLDDLIKVFFNKSKCVPLESESESISHETLPVIDEIDDVKLNLKTMDVTDHKPIQDLKDEAKLDDKLNELDRESDSNHYNKTQLMEPLFSQRCVHIKTQSIEVYILEKKPNPISIGDIPWNKLNEERWRLLTYAQYPHSAKKSAILLAAEGFAYYGTGRGSDDSVICYFCCSTKSGWLTSDVISEIHAQLSPDCCMVTGQNCSNVRMTMPAKGIDLFNQITSYTEASTVEDNRQKTGNEDTNEIECDSAPSQLTERQYNLSASPIESSRHTVQTQASNNVQMANQTISPSSATNISVSQEAASPTVIHNQPANSNVSSSAMVLNSSTLHSSSPSNLPNRTQTTFVQQENRGLTSTAETAPSSTTAGTTVQTSNGQQMSGPSASLSSTAASSQINQSNQNTSASSIPNTNQTTNQSQTNSPQIATANTSNATKVAEKGPTYGDLGIITERPKRFEYAVRATRFASFEPWPRDHHLKKEDLADAGFYYAGYGDCARCFYCGGGLRNWEDEDNVWVEHARWFPKCAYIRQTIGQQFVNVVQDLNKSHDKITYKMVTDKMGSSAASFHLDSVSMPLKRDPAVQTVLDLGYVEADVIEAAKYVKDMNGILSADKVFERLEQMGKPRPKTENSQTQKNTFDPKQDELVLKKLKEENSQLRQQTACKICMDKEVSVVFLPCGHFVSCTDCAAAMKDCPVCRKQVRGIVRAYIG